MSDPEGASLEGKTIAQPEALQQVSREQSVPKGVVQHPEAPKIAGYILTRPLGRGAFAEVWRAWQVRTRKTVAIKVFVKSHGVDWLYLQREVERLIRLDKHPHIVSLLDADLQGEPPYYAMDLMEGGSLERYVGLQERPPTGAVQQWAEEIADALAFVHAKGLLHCDLKPANVMLDEQGHVRVADFGQSRILTDSAGALGTFFFMAPEQAVLNEDVGELHPDVRWDVFAVGTTLYAVLAGRLPFAEERAKLEAAKSLKDRLAAYRKLVASSLLTWDGPPAPGEEDLRAIIAKCAAPAPESRYQSVSAIKADLDSMRRLLPVSPLAHSRAYRARRFVQRNLALVALGTFAAAGLVFTGVQVVKAREDAERRLAFSYAMRGRHFSELGDDAAAAAYYAEACKLDASPLARAAALAHLDQLPVPSRIYPHKWGVRAVALSPDGKRLATGSWDKGASLWDAEAKESERTLLAHDASVTAVGFDKAGTRIVTADRDGRVRVWDAATGERRAELAGHAGEISLAHLSPDGRRVLTYGSDRSLRLWDAQDGRPGSALLESAEVSDAGFSPDGSLIAAGGAGGTLRVWRGPAPQASQGQHPGGILSLAFSPSGAWLASLGRDGTVLLWDARASTLTATALPVKTASALAFDGAGRLAVGGADGLVQVWAAERPERAPLTLPQGSPIRSLAFTTRGDRLAAGDEAGLVRFWSAESGRPLGGALRHGGPVEAILAAESGTLLTAAADGSVRLWTAMEAAWPGDAIASNRGTASPSGIPAGLTVLRHGEGPISVAFAGERTLLTSGGSTLLRSWDLSTGKREAEVEAADASHAVARAAFSSDGRKLVGMLKGGGLQFASQGSIYVSTGAAEALSAAFGPGVVAVGDQSGSLAFWKTAGERPLSTLQLSAAVGAVAFAPGADLVAAGTADGTLFIARAGESHKRLRLIGQNDWVSSVAFSPDGKRVLAASWDGTARIWDLRACEAASTRSAALPRLAPRGGAGLLDGGDAVPSEPSCEPSGGSFRHGGDVSAAVFDPTGRLAASADWSGAANVWDAATGESSGATMRHPGGISSLAFSPDGHLVLTGGSDGTARIWDAASGEPVWRAVNVGAPVSAVAFSPDGAYAVAAGIDGAARVWPIGAGADRAPLLRLRAAVAGQRRVNDKGDLELVASEELPALRAELNALEGR